METKIKQKEYELVLEEGGLFARLLTKGQVWTRLFLGAEIDCQKGDDESFCPGKAKISDESYGQKITIEFDSSVWQKKRLSFECHEETLEIYAEVEGNTRLRDVHLLGGKVFSKNGNGFIRSEFFFNSIFSPEPNVNENWVSSPNIPRGLSVCGSSLPGQRHWFFTPPPLCYALNMTEPSSSQTFASSPWLGIAVLPEPGENNFIDIDWNPKGYGYCLTFHYENHLPVDRKFRTPKLVFYFNSGSPYEVINRYRQLYFEHFGHRTSGSKPAWWHKPIFCGWGSQFCLAGSDVGKAADFSTQRTYDQALKILSKQGLNPGIVVIDDKWQDNYGTNKPDLAKWPNLARWIGKRHIAGQHVLLWWKLMDPEGIAADECITDEKGNRVSVDPLSPAYRKRVSQTICHLLGDLDADGLKLDFSGRTPSGCSLKGCSDRWGIELLYALMKMIYDAAKAVKPDALIIAHSPHPYFEDVFDMVRLNDMNPGCPIGPEMIHRQKIAKAACPDKPIDTDNFGPGMTLNQWRDYIKLQPELGIPSLYYSTGLTKKDNFTEKDYAMLRSAWQKYSRKL